MWLDMLGYFSRFAATGDPNARGRRSSGLAYDKEADPYLALDIRPMSVGSNAAEKCDFWDGEDYLVPRAHELSSRTGLTN